MELANPDQLQAPANSGALARRILGLFAPYRWLALTLLVSAAVMVTLELVSLTFFGRLVDEMNSSTGSRAGLTSLFAIFVVLAVSSQLLSVLVAYVNHLIGQRVMHQLRAALHQRLQAASVRFFTENRTGEVLSRVGTDVNAVQGAVTGTFTDLVTSLLTLCIAFTLMLMIQWELALVTLLVIPIWSYPTYRVGRVMRRLTQEWHEEMGQMTAHVEETLSVSGSMVVKSFGRQDYEGGRFARVNDNLLTLSMRRMMTGRWFLMGMNLFGVLIPGAAYWFLGGLVVQGEMTAGTVVSFALLAQQVFGPVANIARIGTSLVSSMALFERIFEYVDMPLEIEERAEATRIEEARGRLAFEQVSFGYVDGQDVLSDVSFEVAPGSMLALVGPSGAGKTTIASLLQRFYDPRIGTVRLDGHDLRDLTLESVSDSVGVVMQDTQLFHTSFAENIRYGRLAATDSEVRAAASAAGLDELLERLPAGLDTMVGERGYRLSGGEQQRVAIARAILKQPPVLILDEATASLDSRLERVIHEAMERLTAGRTSVVIAHRLSTVLAADQILVLDAGHVVERGRHQELLALGGLYAELYEEQFRETATAPSSNGSLVPAG